MPNHTPEYRAYKLLQQIILGAAIIIGALTFAMFALASDKSKHRCEDLQNLRSYVLGATDRAIDSLPTIDYYRKHPAERARALENLQQQRDEFSTPLDCSLF